MSDSNWSTRATAIAVVYSLGCAIILGFVFYFAGFSEGAKSAEAQNYAARYPADTDKRISECFAGPDLLVRPCIEEAITASRDAQRSEEDLNAQKSMAEWAKWLLIVTVITLFLSAAGLVALLRTLAQGREANKIAKKAISEGNRAWLRLTVGPEARYEIHKGAYFITVNANVENVGAGVAAEIAINFRCFTRNLDPSEKAAKSFSELEQSAQWGACITQTSSPTMFPGGKQALAAGGRNYYGEFESGKRHIVYVIVWVEYRLPQDDPAAPKRITEAIGMLGKLNGDTLFWGNEFDGRNGKLDPAVIKELGNDYEFARAPRIT